MNANETIHAADNHSSISKRDLRAGEWQPIETAPKDGRTFLAYQDGEVYAAKYDEDERLCYRTHHLFVKSKYRIIDAEMDGESVRAEVAIEKPWNEEFWHDWTLWERGFDFAPSLWTPLAQPNDDRAGLSNGTASREPN